MKRLLAYLVVVVEIVWGSTDAPFPLKIASVYGSSINHWERKQFVNALGHELEKRGEIVLTYDSPYRLVVKISHYHRPNPHKGTKHHYKIHTKFTMHFWVKDRWDYPIYSGSVDTHPTIDMETSGDTSAYRYALKSLFRMAGEDIASRLNESASYLLRVYRKKYPTAHKAQTIEAHQSNQATLLKGESLDFENALWGDNIRHGDIAWIGDAFHDDILRMEFLGRTRYAVVRRRHYDRIDSAYAKRLKLQGYALFGRVIHRGTVFVIKTGSGTYVKMKVVGFKRYRGIDNYGIRVAWELL